MKEQVVTHEQSLAEFMFIGKCIFLYDTKGVLYSDIKTEIDLIQGGIPYNTMSYKGSAAPFKQQVFEWFIEKHDLFGKTQPYISDVEPFNLVWEFVILDLNWGEDKDIHLNTRCSFSSPKEAESACIDKLIEICKIK